MDGSTIVAIAIAICTAVLSLIGYLIKLAIGRVIAAGDSMTTQLSTLNSAVTGINVWQNSHEKHDIERHTENLQKFDQIFDALTHD